MQKLHIIVDHKQDWAPYYPSDQLISAEDYLSSPVTGPESKTRVINLCSDYDYLGTGYYCSLLAEARSQRVIPSIRSITDLANHQYYRLYDIDLNRYLSKCVDTDSAHLQVKIFFGCSALTGMEKLAQRLFELYPCPILVVKFERRERWEISSIMPGQLTGLDEDEQTVFADAIDRYSRTIWRKPRSRKRFRFDLAILCDSGEKLAPSNPKALKNFIRAGNELGMDVDLIGKNDYARLLEYDALFIRETTAIDHHTYRFAKRAENEGMVVLDDPDSILKCTNKVFLADLLTANKVPTPKTRLLMRDKGIDCRELERYFGYPMVLKIPHGSFSVGVVKVQTRTELEQQCQLLFKDSAILLCQEYVLTDYDWRIGFLNNKPIFACQYFMARGHWQIYNHSVSAKQKSGDFTTLPIHQVPKDVLKTATRAVKLIGDGLYGVDMKQLTDRNVIIEINDNPNIDSGIEDAWLGEDLYRTVMGEFLRRLEKLHNES